MRKLSDLNGYSPEMKHPTVDPNIFRRDVRFRGGTKGKKEQRKHVSVEGVIGRSGSTTYFRGSCWNCGETYIGNRSSKTKSLLKCPDCDETSFIYKGYFNDRDRYPIESYVIPNKDEVRSTVYICYVKYSDLNPNIGYFTESKYKDRQGKKKYKIDLLDKI